jgi:hypothetical protein
MGRRYLLVGIVLLLIVVGLLMPVGQKIWDQKIFFSQVRSVRSQIESLAERPPKDTDPDKWRRAVEWTSNVIVQDFFAPTSSEAPGLQSLVEQLPARLQADVNYETLQWIWDMVEIACGPRSCAIRFRDIPLLTKDPISDENLANVWSLDRIEGIDLSGSEITDASLHVLKDKKNLRLIVLPKTRVTEEAVEALRRERPDCEISLL